ncbi:MAG: hypothetical protein MUP21_10000 [Dehalococcoidia bacterium]|nr:hypothetical protein [Dehalococcoidia bacterium]
MTIENTGEFKLMEVEFQLVPWTGNVSNPFSEPANPCNDGIVPGQKCFCHRIDSTHIEIQLNSIYEETYLVIYAEDSAGDKFGVTFKLLSTDENSGHQ